MNTQEILEQKFATEDLLKGPTKLVRINLSALTRKEWSAEVRVPVFATDDDLHEVCELFYDALDGSEFYEDVDFWEKGDLYAEEV